MLHSTTALLVALFFFSTSVTAATETYTIDPTHTYPHFAVSHLGFSTMRGRFDKSSGKLTIDRAAKVGSIEITIRRTRDTRTRIGNFSSRRLTLWLRPGLTNISPIKDLIIRYHPRSFRITPSTFQRSHMSWKMR